MIAPPVTPTLSQYGHRGEPIQPSETSVIDGVGEGEVVGDTVRDGELVEVEDRQSAPTAYPAMPEFNENPVVALL